MNIYETLGLPEVINASGRMTKLGVSCISDPVAPGRSPRPASSMWISTGSTKLPESGWPNGSTATKPASPLPPPSGIVLSIASLLCRDDLYKIQHLEETKQTSERREVLLLKGQNVDFGHRSI